MGNKAKHGIIFWILGLFFSPYNWKWHWRKVSCLFYINPFCFSCNCLCILWFKKSKLESHLSKCSLKSWRLWGKFVQREAGFFIKFWRFWPEREQVDKYFLIDENGIALTKSWLRPSVGSSHFYPAVPSARSCNFLLCILSLKFSLFKYFQRQKDKGKSCIGERKDWFH